MASTFSVSDILSDAAERSNCPAFATNTRVTLQRATYWLAQSARSLCALLRTKRPKDREFLQWANPSTVANYPIISLPPDCGEVQAVVWRRSSRDYVLLQSASADDLALVPLDDGKGWDASEVVPRWRLEGQAIALYPTSGIAESLDVFYTSHISPTSGTFQGQLGFDEWVTLNICINVATSKREWAAVSEFQKQLKLLENDLLAPDRQRDQAERHTMRDLRERNVPSYLRRVR